MKRLILILVMACSASVLIAQDQGMLTDARISFIFVSKNVEGTISGFSSTTKIDKNNISNSKIDGSVETKTLDSGNFLRNWSLKGGKYFDVDTYPKINFESESITENEDGFTVVGQLTMKGVRKPITVVFKIVNDELLGSTTLFSSDFGIEVMKKSREANKVVVQMSFKLN
jgi:polyisoprenoid-binding protein YceI